MANVKVSELTELTTPVTADLFLVVDDSESGSEKSKYVTYENLAKVLLPPGMVAPFACSAPTGWLPCDGKAVSRVTYANLFAVISDDYGNGDGSTTFNLPDYRGLFLRMVSTTAEGDSGVDPDRDSRTDRGDGTVGDNIGTKQADAIESHTHGLGYRTVNNGVVNAVLGAGSDTITSSTGGNETRPTNVYVNYCIKF